MLNVFSNNRVQFLQPAGGAAALLLAGAIMLGGRLDGAAAPSVSSPANLKEHVFRESRALFANPERGLYSTYHSDHLGNLSALRQQGISLLLVEADLRDFKDRDLSTEKLLEVREAFAAARRAGLKVIFRAAYGFTGRDYRTDPKDMDRILGHIRQLAAVLSDNADVLCGVQAGMLGPWGEWHDSNWGEPPSLEARRKVLFGWLDALPASVTVDVRRPMFIRDIFASEPGGCTLTEPTAYKGSRLARTGFHDDAFLAMPNDSGTFVEPGWDRQRELQWCSQHGQFTPSGGETVPTSIGTPIAQVVREMELFHTSYLNSSYHRATLNGWREADYCGENGFEQVARRLGYRLVAQRLLYSAEVKHGESCRFELTLRNVGFAAPHLPREVAVALWGAGEAKPAKSLVLKDADPRYWNPQAGAITLRGEIPAAADLPPGNWRLALRLADPAPSLHEDGRYAIRLADDDVTFSGDSGWNILAEDVTIR